MENVLMLSLTRILFVLIFFYLINLQLTGVARNDECGGLDAAKKSAISTFRAKYKLVLLK